MDEFTRATYTAIERLEFELIVRDFITVLNEGSTRELHAFLADDVHYRPSAQLTVYGRSDVVAMIEAIKRTFQEWRVFLVSVAVTGDVVLAEQSMSLRLPGCEPHLVMGFASFRLQNSRISAWHQIHA
ncbi:nuclear transport factor 2 family protein [Microbacterium sp. 1P10AE]|jgi:limonene-1,2-epoxide hydrolase|uniref:nuclear transport factor 2 family protein n=1 Tax=Microbacterium sp. 1P10AE TaxID=3132286 RepID=UPI0039A0DF92